LIREGFYVIVPLEYASSGILPPEWFIDELMKFLRQPYYVGLLSAAAIHGAAHQQPQEFHVVIPEALRSIKEHLPENLEIRWNELVEVAGRRQTRHCVAN
jgi:predicted transcriptional regulator of viral defense system